MSKKTTAVGKQRNRYSAEDVVNTGSVLVASRDVEESLYLHDDIAEVAVIGIPDDK